VTVRGDPALPASQGPNVDLLSRLGHQLRSPLAGIIGLSRILATRLAAGTADPTQLARQLDLIRTTAAGALSAIERMIDIARIDSGRVTGDLRPIDCREVLTETARTFQSAAQQRGLCLETELPADPVIAITDPAVLGRILTELVGNAVKFTDTGGVRLRITATTAGSATRPGPTPTVIEVADDGPGVPAGERIRIFDPFEHGENVTDGSAGLGLHLARRLADLISAEVTIRDQSGPGSTFAVTFPGRPT